MNKQKILILIPFALVTVIVIYCWINALANNFIPTWRHYTGLMLFIPLIILFFRDMSKATIGLGIFLLLATFNVLAITPAITTSWLNLGSSGLHTPPVQLPSLGLFVLYFIMNLDSLINIRLNYKEAKTVSAKTKTR